jgi:branched-chain amino acid aminotransferase
VYPTPAGSVIFRLQAHTRRMLDSAKIHRIRVPYSADVINAACCEVITRNGLDNGAYLRPVVFRGYGDIGLAPLPEHPVDVAIAAWEWGAYLGADGLENGVDVCVSSWQRVAPNTMPALAKAGGNYLASTLVSLEARERGFAEGIALAVNGTVSEGAGENVFLVRDGRLYTPPAGASILTGITRDTVMTLATELGIEVLEQSIPREMLYIADEIFLTGTAAEVTPVRSVDSLVIGNGGRGPITKQLQDSFFGLFDGRTQDRWGWLEPVAAGHGAGNLAASN